MKKNIGIGTSTFGISDRIVFDCSVGVPDSFICGFHSG